MGMHAEPGAVVTGNTSRFRVAEHRSKNVRLDVSIAPRTGDVIDALASHYDCSRAVVVRSLLRFALTNRDWFKVGLIWRED